MRKRIGAFIFLVSAHSPAYGAGEWASNIDYGNIHSARAYAQEKQEFYTPPRPEDVQLLKRFLEHALPDRNADIFQKGIELFYSQKNQKWRKREILRVETLNDILINSRKFKNTLTKEDKMNQDWADLINYALASYKTTYFIAKSLIGLKKIHELTAQLLENMDEYNVRGIFSVRSLSSIKTISEHLYTQLQGDKSPERLRIIHWSLDQKIKSIMGWEVTKVTRPYGRRSSQLSMLDFFKSPANHPEGVVDHEKPLASSNVSSWRKGKPLSDALPFDHGDEMAFLNRALAPQIKTTYYEYINSQTQEIKMISHLSQKTRKIPQTLSLSVSVPTRGLFIEKDGNGWKLISSESLKNIDPTLKDQIMSSKKEFLLAFPDVDISAPLEQKHLDFIQEKTAEMRSFHNFFKVQNDHILVFSPWNSPIELQEGELGYSALAEVAPQYVKNHTLLALNYDFIGEKKYSSSSSAGYYQDISVCIPSAWVSVLDPTEETQVPDFFAGGHSSAAAMLSAITAHVRGRFPILNYLEIKKAVLRGADKNIPGYDPKIHGQGMVNIPGALREAQCLAGAKNSHKKSPIKKRRRFNKEAKRH